MGQNYGNFARLLWHSGDPFPTYHPKAKWRRLGKAPTEGSFQELFPQAVVARVEAPIEPQAKAAKGEHGQNRQEAKDGLKGGNAVGWP